MGWSCLEGTPGGLLCGAAIIIPAAPRHLGKAAASDQITTDMGRPPHAPGQSEASGGCGPLPVPAAPRARAKRKTGTSRPRGHPGRPTRPGKARPTITTAQGLAGPPHAPGQSTARWRVSSSINSAAPRARAKRGAPMAPWPMPFGRPTRPGKAETTPQDADSLNRPSHAPGQSRFIWPPRRLVAPATSLARPKPFGQLRIRLAHDFSSRLGQNPCRLYSNGSLP